MFFSLPIFLVACRLVVHLLFSSLYPLWCQTSEGGTAMEQVGWGGGGAAGPACLWAYQKQAITCHCRPSL